MEINCLGCGFKIDLDDVYDDYEGRIKCFVCGATSELVTVGGRLESLRQVLDSDLALAREKDCA